MKDQLKVIDRAKTVAACTACGFAAGIIAFMIVMLVYIPGSLLGGQLLAGYPWVPSTTVLTWVLRACIAVGVLAGTWIGATCE